MLVLATNALQRFEVGGELGPADGLGRAGEVQPASQMARPMVLVPTSSPASLPPLGQRGGEFGGAGGDHALPCRQPPLRIARGSRPRTRHNRRRGNCCRAARRARASGCRRRCISKPLSQRAPTWPGSRVAEAQVARRAPACPGWPRAARRRPSVPVSGLTQSMSLALALRRRSGPLVLPRRRVTRSGLAGSAKLCQRQDAAGLVGRVQAGRPSAGRSAVDADRPADDIGGDEPAAQRLACALGEQPHQVQRALAVPGEDDRLGRQAAAAGMRRTPPARRDRRGRAPCCASSLVEQERADRPPGDSAAPRRPRRR